MKEAVCSFCHAYFTTAPLLCPQCAHPLVYTGDNANVITTLSPTCLIHRYRGSDRLEPAVILSEGRTKLKVAVRLRDYSRPLTVPKAETYAFDQTLFDRIESLRQERTRAMQRYDETIAALWQTLTPYYGSATFDPHNAPRSSSPTVTNE